MIGSLLNSCTVNTELVGTERDEVLAELTESLIKLNPALNRQEVLSDLISREDKKSTLVTKDVAVPHVSSDKISSPVVVLGISKKGVEFDLESFGEDSVARIFFCILFPKDKADLHLLVLKDVLTIVKYPGLVEKILQSETPSDICELITKTGV